MGDVKCELFPVFSVHQFLDWTIVTEIWWYFPYDKDGKNIDISKKAEILTPKKVLKFQGIVVFPNRDGDVS